MRSVCSLRESKHDEADCPANFDDETGGKFFTAVADLPIKGACVVAGIGLTNFSGGVDGECLNL